MPRKKGYKHTPETRAKMRISNHPMLGKRHTPETKAKMRIAQLGHPMNKKTRTKISTTLMGHPVDAETRKKISEGQRGEKNHCYGKMGDKAPGWKGGITPENYKIRSGLAMREWRRAIFVRDDFTCQKCGVRGAHLHAHHIIPFSVNKDKRFDEDNGKTLCFDCHHNLHSFRIQADIY